MKELIGRKIVEIRPMSKAEMEAEGWSRGRGTVIILDDGMMIYPSKDGEGNGPGVLFGKDKEGTAFYITG